MSSKEDILTITADLFYTNGYNNTGLAEILSKCNLAKTSLYHHFGSKAGLGIAYLERMKEELFTRIHKWVNKRESLSEYLRAWIWYIKKSIKENKFQGCPFASFAYGLSMDDLKIFSPKMEEISKEWISLLSEFIRSLQKDGKLKKDQNPSEIASEMLAIYHGHVTLWKLTRDSKQIETMDRKFKELAKSVERR
ncbi:TetR/AcrR family transcriptional regulator [Leptospira selangorensis]|uniref:TetR/AcrR family transcriptional regulator n=1 Tax=Leptospira selangorensis TaxID=2484982 RepID=UPI0010830833|nr:TetR/AcrR family transcriptional regulator [Leptospira selangorensis]TGK00459.1 TetR/AcrR family transcriptional regulator [Leptospira selangorensis]